MQNDHEEILQELKDKIQAIIGLYDKTKEEKHILEKENQELQSIIDDKENIINQLQEENKTLKIAKTIVSGEDTHNTKITINRIVREIDKCIALLNK